MVCGREHGVTHAVVVTGAEEENMLQTFLFQPTGSRLPSVITRRPLKTFLTPSPRIESKLLTIQTETMTGTDNSSEPFTQCV